MRAAPTVVLLAALAAACSAGPGARFPPTLPPETVLRGPPTLEDAVAPPEADVLGLDAGMTAFLAGHVSMAASPPRRLDQLLDALMGHGGFEVEYERETQTAAGLFHSRRGNCLSFTNLFVAFARQAGLRAGYEEVEVPPDWTKQGQNLILTRHINAWVQVPGAEDRIVDFDTRQSVSRYETRRISDARARAHFDSNLGVDRLLAGDGPGAAGYFRRALATDPTFAPAWVNLGVLWSRAGHAYYAEAAYRQALAADPGDPAALDNLAELYRQGGRDQEAAEIAREIESWRLRNPWYRYFLAQQAYDAGDYDTAISHLKVAVGRHPTEDRFCALLGMSYSQRHDTKKARRWLLEAESLAPDEDSREAYRELLDRLPGAA